MSEETTPTPVILEQDLIYVISDLHLGDGTRSDVFSLGDSITKRDHMRSLIKEVKENDGHLLIVGDLLDLQQGWSIDRVVTANAILLRELSDLGADGRLTYIWSELDEDLSYYQELLNIIVAQEVHIPAPDHTPEVPPPAPTGAQAVNSTRLTYRLSVEDFQLLPEAVRNRAEEA